ncbi:MAG: O-acetylhomoserine aminocarboxypropyltransferase/cysteine synthase [Chloroflexi bacterium]|nr:O-acetylhomoserine aminocarboxypropyltransferase/cysteine synthase [Chloroflexota bacterium]
MVNGVDTVVARGAELLAAAAQQRQAARQRRFDTLAVHGLYDMNAALNNLGSINEPAYLSPAQHFENSDHMEAALAYQYPGWIYSRVANPTVNYLEETLALLEGYGCASETSACATASGTSAVFMATVPFLSVQAGQHMNIVASARCYGGTFMLFSQRYALERGVELRWVKDPLDLHEWASKIDAQTRFVFGELPSNPGLAMFDVQALADMAHGWGIPLIVDSTIATPALLRPLCHGADIVVQSLSKAMTSGGFVIAGAVIARHNIPSKVGTDELRANFAQNLKLLSFRDHGPALSPFNALMTLNDLRSLRSRLDVMSRNTLKVAQFLQQQPGVEQVFYPGLATMREHEVARRYMWLVDGDDDGQPVNRYSHLLSFTVKGGMTAARRVFDAFQIIWRATDLGKHKSVATIPAISTHQQQGESGRDLAAVLPHQIRLSVGTEHPDDIMRDLEQALARA